MAKSKVAQFNKHKHHHNNNAKKDDKNNRNDEVKNEKWYIKFFKSFIAIIVTILIYTFVIKILTQYSMVITQSVIQEKGLESDPVLILVFCVGLSSTIMAVFIAKVNVYKLIISLSDKAVKLLQNGLNKQDKKTNKQKTNKKVNDNNGRGSK